MKNNKKTKNNGLTATGEPKTEINTMPTDESIREEVVLTFGRFNPPTIGHQRLVEYMHEIAEGTKADVHVYLSHRQDTSKNLLEYETKLQLCREAFGDCVVDSECKNLLEILTSLSGKYMYATVVVGSDREMEFAERLPLYNGDLFEFAEINVIGVDRRDGISSTLMREYLVQDDEFAFCAHLPSKLCNQYKEIMESMLSLSDLRSADFKMVKVLTPNGKWTWRKVKRDQNLMATKQSLSVSTQKPLKAKNTVKRVMKYGLGESVSQRIGQFTKKQKQFKIIQTDEEAITELSQRSVMSYFGKAANERGKAEYLGDTKTLKKRDRGLTSAIKRSHKWWGKK